LKSLMKVCNVCPTGSKRSRNREKCRLKAVVEAEGNRDETRAVNRRNTVRPVAATSPGIEGNGTTVEGRGHECSHRLK